MAVVELVNAMRVGSSVALSSLSRCRTTSASVETDTATVPATVWDAGKLFTELAMGSGAVREEGDDLMAPIGNPSERLDLLVREYMDTAKEKSYAVATRKILADPKNARLARAYAAFSSKSAASH